MSFRLILASTSLLALAACGQPDRPADAPAAAQAGAPVLTANQIDEARITTPVVAAPPAQAPAPGAVVPPDPALVRLQVLLDRSTFSPASSTVWRAPTCARRWRPTARPPECRATPSTPN